MILFVDTALKTNYIALYDGDKLLKLASFSQADQLVDLLHAFKPPLKELTGLAVGKGPGSYTGVRQGVIAMQAMAYSLNLPLTGIGSLELFKREPKEAVILDARIGGFYVLHDGGVETMTKERLFDLQKSHTKLFIMEPEVQVKVPEISFENAVLDMERMGNKIGGIKPGPIEILYLRNSPYG